MPIFGREEAEVAGIDLPREPNYCIQYGGSRVGARKVEAYIHVADQEMRVDVAFVDRLDLPYALLGRRGVFTRFREVAFLEKLAAPRVEFRW